MENSKNIDKMDGVEFENLVEKLVFKMGFITERTKRSFDGGIDIIAINEQPLFDGKYIIQCKRYSNSIGEPILRDLYGVVNSEHANKGILITNSYFTKSAKEFAKNKPIELIDGKKLTSLLDKYLDISIKKEGSELKIPETYKITVELLGPIVKKISEKRLKIKNGLIYVDRKNLTNDKAFYSFLQKKQSTLSSLIQTMANQINHLYVVWENSKGEKEKYTNLSEVKMHCGELARSMSKLESEWEEFYTVEASINLHKLHTIACDFYEAIFKENERIIQTLEDVINSPESYTFKENSRVNLLASYDVSSPAEEFSKEIKSLTKKQGFNWKSCSSSTGGFLILVAIILSAIFVSAIF